MTGVYEIKVKGELVLKYLRKTEDVAREIHNALKNPRHWVLFNKIIKFSYRKPLIGKHICRGYLLDMKGYNPRSRGDYCSPLIHGTLLSEIDIYKLSMNEKIFLLFSIQELLTNLYLYKNKEQLLCGDWTFHNIIWEQKSGILINIDLEGFYTYSEIGPKLPWIKKENRLNFITKNFKQLQRQLFKSFAKPPNQSNKLTIIRLPCQTQVDVLFPYLYKNNIQNISPYIFNIDFGELEGYKTQNFHVYYLIGNNDKISNIITTRKEQPTFPHRFYYFTFKACLEKGYEHPIGIKLEQRRNPKRTILTLVFDDGDADFYVKTFKDNLM